MKRLLAIFCLLGLGPVAAQNTIGLPAIINYSKEAYRAGSQNWEIAQDKQGLLYFANTEGLLCFDGSSWRTYLLPNETKLHSLAIGKDGRIYVGSQNEIGYFSPGRAGRLVYTSLNPLIPKDQLEFAEVWDIILIEDQVFFRSNRRIFEYGGGKITVYKSIDWNFLGYSNQQLLAHDFKAGLLLYSNGYWAPLNASGDFPLNARITSFIPLNKDSSLITTRKQGMFILSANRITPFVSPDVKEISALNVSAATVIDSQTVAVATNLGGCFIIDHQGKIIRRLSRPDGMQNNNVLSLFPDRDGNLWLGLHKGIDFVAYSNPIKQIFPDNVEHSAGYTSLIYHNNLYLGTNHGLYRAPLGSEKDLGYMKTSFEFIPGTKGQVWNLSEVNGQLFMGHNDGAYHIKGSRAIPLDTSSGFWSFQAFDNILPSSIMATGTYNGINFYNYENGKFINKNIHSHFESAQYVTIDNGIIWVMHPYNGLYKVTYDSKKPSYTVYNDKHHILSKKRNYLLKIKNRLILSNDRGIFEYNGKSGTFEPSEYFHQLFGDERVQYLKEDPEGNIWFIQSKKLGVVDFSGSSPRTVYLPELDNKVMAGNHEFIYPYNTNNIFVAGEEGFYVINYEKYRLRRNDLTVLIRSVKSAGKSDSVYFDGYAANKRASGDAVSIRHRFNSLHFEYASPAYNQQTTVEYSYYLEGFDEHWSDWSKKNEKDYTNLPAGAYTFHVKARSHAGNTSAASSYSFRILPPWYRTLWADGLYVLLTALVIWFLYRWQKRKFLLQQKRHEEEQQRIQYLHQLELQKTESEIIRLKNEKLENEIHHKNAELASTAMNLVHKGEMLTRIKDEVTRMRNTSENGQSDDEYKKIIRLLEENKTLQDWDVFAQHFDKVYSDFLAALKEKYPNLTAGETKLCAYLRLNLSCKEIAQLMNITIKSVELSRYRLRKKLQLPSEVNLSNFLAAFHSEYKNGKERKHDVEF